jgi:hypothetical protein
VALAVSGANLYAGGVFRDIGKWNGSTWSTLGTVTSDGPVSPEVCALVVSDTNLYAGGYFTRAGGTPATNIAKWNGSVWSALGSGLGSGMNNEVRTLAVSGTNLYAGGIFTKAGGVTANYVATWNGSAWLALGSGMSDSVLALAADGLGHLFVGGGFSFAGTNLSAYIAQANIIPPRGEIERIGAGSGSVTLDCVGVPGSAYAVQRATDVQFEVNLATLFTTNPPSPDGLFRWTDNSPPSPAGFYRLRRE